MYKITAAAARDTVLLFISLVKVFHNKKDKLVKFSDSLQNLE